MRRASSMAAGVASLCLAAPAVLSALLPALAGALEFDRGRIAAGELWRWIGGHWTHWTLTHLGWDLLAFVVLVYLGWREERQRLVAALVSSAVLIPAAVWFALPEMQLYRGLSGIDSALFVSLAASRLRSEWREGRRGPALLFAGALAAFAAKVAFELVSGGTLFVPAGGFVPVPLAHVVGGLCGLAAGFASSSAATRPAALRASRRPG